MFGRFAALFCSADVVKHGFQLLAEVALNDLDLILREIATPDQAAGVNVTHSGLVIDDLVHLGLRHRRVVSLVVATTSVADEVNEHIFTELTSVLNSQLGNPDHSFGVIAVHVEHGAPECLSQVRCVLAGAARIRGRREPDLVIHRDVDSSANGVATKLRQVDGFLHDTQARHSSVAVDQDRHHREALIAAVQNVLLGARNALSHGVHGFQVRRVRRERDVHFTVVEHGDEVAGFAQVVLHVAGATGGRGVNIALELGEDL